MKVYCKDCKWCKLMYKDSKMKLYHRCHKITSWDIKETPFKQVKEEKNPLMNRANIHNDCVYYKHKWYKFWEK